jgi:hypothetical protein
LIDVVRVVHEMEGEPRFLGNTRVARQLVG